MKRILGLFLSLCLLLTLAACGAEPDSAQQPTDATGAPQTEATDAAVTTDAATEAPTAPATEDAAGEATEEPTQPVSYSTDSADLVSNDDLVFTVSGFANNEHLGLEMRVSCQNKTDRDITFSLSNVSVCGVMYDPLWSEEVAAGQRVDSIVYFDTFALEELGIQSLDEISFRLTAIDSVNWMDDPFADAVFTVYPTGLTAETVSYPAYLRKNGDTVVLDNDRLLFIVEKVDDAGDDTYTLHCYVANKTASDLLVSWDSVSVNGKALDPFWASGVSGGKQLYTQISFSLSDLADLGIETVTEIAFTLSAIDYDSYETLVEESCTFQPK